MCERRLVVSNVAAAGMRVGPHDARVEVALRHLVRSEFDAEIAGESSGTLSAGGDAHDNRPSTAGALLVGSAVNAVELAFVSASTGKLAARRSGAGRSRRSSAGTSGSRGDSGRRGNESGLSSSRSRGGRDSGTSTTGGRRGSRSRSGGRRSNGRARSRARAARRRSIARTDRCSLGGAFASVRNRGARVREDEISAIGGAATVSNIGDEHLGEISWKRALGGVGAGVSVPLFDLLLNLEVTRVSRTLLCGSDSDGSAVHVHLAIALIVEPGPGESVGPRVNGVGNGVREDSSISERVGIGIFEVTAVVGRTATNDRVDDDPVRAGVRLSIGSQADLARATGMDDTAFEAEVVGLANGHVVSGDGIVVDASAKFAREVGAIGSERRVVDSAGSIRIGRVHDHMRVSDAEKRGCSRDGSSSEAHLRL